MIIDMELSLGLVLILALASSAFFSASEAAYLSLDRVALNRLERATDIFSRATFFLRKRLSSFIVTLLLMNMFSNIVATVVAVMLLEQILVEEIFLATTLLSPEQYVLLSEVLFLLVFSLVLIIVCEFFPKRLAVHYAIGYSRAVAMVLLPVYGLLMPVVLPVAWMIRSVIGKIRFPLGPEVPQLSDAEQTSPADHVDLQVTQTKQPKQSKYLKQAKQTKQSKQAKHTKQAKALTALSAHYPPHNGHNNGHNGHNGHNGYNRHYGSGEAVYTPQNGQSHRVTLDDEYFFRIPFDHDQFLSYVNLSSNVGVLKEVEFGLLKNFVKCKSMEVRLFMIPREPMKGLDLDKKRSVDSLKKAIRQFPFKNIPFYRTQKDNIVGVLSQEKCALSRQLLEFNSIHELEKHLEKPINILTTKNVLEALEDILNSDSDVALVSDEYGGIEGIVTYDDIVFRFFGRVPGAEHKDKETDRTLIKSVGKGFFRVPGNTPLSEINEYFAINMTSETVETLGGYLLEHFRSIPKRYETYQDIFFEYTIQERTQKGINVVILKRVPTPKSLQR